MPSDPRANFRITADNSDYRRKLRQAHKDTETFSDSVGRALRAGAAAGAAAITATAIALTRLTAEASKSADALAKQADKLGIATEKLAALQLAGRLTGVQNEKLTLGLQRMTRRIAEAAQGSGEAQGALRELGLDAAAIAQLPLDQQFLAVSRAMASVTSQSDKIRLGFKLFDSEGVDLIRTLDVMADKFPQIEADVRAFGTAISRVDAKQIENANDALERAREATRGIGTAIAVAIAPIREDLANTFVEAARQTNGFEQQIETTMRALVLGANAGANAVRAIAIAFKTAELTALSVRESIARALPETTVRFRGEPILQFGDNSAEAADLRAQIDAVGAEIDALVGKFTTGEEALTRFTEIRTQAAQRAQAELQAQASAEATQRALDAERLEEETIAIKQRDEAFFERARERARVVEQIERESARRRVQINQAAEAAIQSLKAQTASAAIGLLQALGTKNKTFAAAAIVLEKALSIQRVLMHTQVAGWLAFASQLIPGDPSSLARATAARAAVQAQGAITAALIGATGIAQIASLGQGSTGAPLGTPTNPLFTESSGAQAAAQAAGGGTPTTVVNINIAGDVNGDTAQGVVTRLREMIEDEDVVLFSSTSRQALDIRGG